MLQRQTGRTFWHVIKQAGRNRVMFADDAR